ncbi:helix-turn-helix domain-containing protein [Anaeroselena agilis]|uniref:XRE family transcriptional regulator n=1 Tax=Anaeroselena agilis TaxID=3063788 RepID=A0ABU3P1N4_9FIRM|nr:XRE family transcriptional regulator [Selenomonadales bacterium 4137-cl]
MNDLNMVIAANLRQVREDRRLSLDKVAEATGVSKSMLGQIERGESNPSITTIWKIASGLKISFTALVNAPQADTVLVSQAEVEPLVSDGGKYRVYPLFPYEEGRRFEIYTVEIEPGGGFESDSHGERTQEFVTVFDGELTLATTSREYTLKRGESIRFRADRPHSYRNATAALTRLSLTIHYPA